MQERHCTIECGNRCRVARKPTFRRAPHQRKDAAHTSQQSCLTAANMSRILSLHNNFSHVSRGTRLFALRHNLASAPPGPSRAAVAHPFPVRAPSLGCSCCPRLPLARRSRPPSCPPFQPQPRRSPTPRQKVASLTAAMAPSWVWPTSRSCNCSRTAKASCGPVPRMACSVTTATASKALD